MKLAILTPAPNQLLKIFDKSIFNNLKMKKNKKIMKKIKNITKKQ